MSRQTEPWVDEALSRLAADDARAVVPARVEAAVMEAWEAHAAAHRVRLGWLPRVRVGALAAAAAVVVAAVVLLWRDRASPPAAPPSDLDYVLVPDPIGDPASLHIVRVRMRRAGLASLGVPLVNPEADGVVEVELVVGEDGVARAIRRAALVSTAEIETGGQR